MKLAILAVVLLALLAALVVIKTMLKRLFALLLFLAILAGAFYLAWDGWSETEPAGGAPTPTSRTTP